MFGTEREKVLLARALGQSMVNTERFFADLWCPPWLPDTRTKYSRALATLEKQLGRADILRLYADTVLNTGRQALREQTMALITFDRRINQ